MNNIPLTRPFIDDEVKKAVLDVLASGFLTEGAVTRALEQTVAEYVGAAHALAVTSCTTGLEIALRACGIGPGDEVVVPDYTYPATASAVALVGAVPVVVDIDRKTMLLSADATRRAVTDKTKAIIPVSLFGNPLDYSWIDDLKRKHSLAVIEDSACSLGAQWRGKKVGTMADISVFSLHPRKFITSGEGGIITTNNDSLADWMRSFKHFGMTSSGAARNQIVFGMMGTNSKLSDVLAAIALTQMKHVDALLASRRRQARRYMALLKNVDAVALPESTPEAEHSWQSFVVYLADRDRVMEQMRSQGVEVQIGTYSLHMHPAFQTNAVRLAGSFEASAYAFAHALVLPLYEGMTEEEQTRVVASLSDTLKRR